MDTSTIMNRKRPIPPSTTSETSSNINEGGTQPQTLSLVQEQPPTLNLENKDNKFKKPTHKKKKTKYADNEDKLNIDELLLPAKTLIENSNSTYVLKYNELQEFLEKSQGCSNIFQLSQEYSTDTAGIIKLIGDFYPHINDRYMKARLTRTKKSSNLNTFWIMTVAQPIPYNQKKTYTQILKINKHIPKMDNWINKNIKILFWNPRSIVNKKEELQKILEEVAIFICVELWLTQKNTKLLLQWLQDLQERPAAHHRRRYSSTYPQ